MTARGHGGPWTGTPGYQVLADDLLAVDATQALGVSLGAGALLRLLSQHPTRYRRVVLFLPAALTRPPVRRPAGLAEALTSRDPAAVEAVVRSELPADLAGASVEAYVRARTAFLLQSDLVPLLEALAVDRPVPDPAALQAVTADVLVLAQRDDPVHPLEVASELLAALPRARLEVFDRPGALFRERARLRALVVGHLTGPGG